jgi:hypothetical protein
MNSVCFDQYIFSHFLFLSSSKEQFSVPGRCKQLDKNGLLRMETVFCLIEYDRLRAVHDLVGDFPTPLSREAMHDNGVVLSSGHQAGVDLKRF